jgi:hypothetical protein
MSFAYKLHFHELKTCFWGNNKIYLRTYKKIEDQQNRKDAKYVKVELYKKMKTRQNLQHQKCTMLCLWTPILMNVSLLRK